MDAFSVQVFLYQSNHLSIKCIFPPMPFCKITWNAWKLIYTHISSTVLLQEYYFDSILLCGLARLAHMNIHLSKSNKYLNQSIGTTRSTIFDAEAGIRGHEITVYIKDKKSYTMESNSNFNIHIFTLIMCTLNTKPVIIVALIYWISTTKIPPQDLVRYHLQIAIFSISHICSHQLSMTKLILDPKLFSDHIQHCL